MHERFEELDRQNRSAAEIAEILGVAPRTVIRWRRDIGSSRPQPPLSGFPVTRERLAAAKVLLDEGAPISEVTSTLHMARETVRRYFPDAGWSQTECAAFGKFCQSMNARMKGK